MCRHCFRGTLGAVLFGALLTPTTIRAQAPPKRDGLEQYRQFLKPPTTVPEYWNAIQFEIELGSYEMAARQLHGLLVKKKPTDEELFALEQQVGMAALLRLRNVRTWSAEVKEQNTAVADVDALITQTTAAVRKTLNDPVRIKKYIGLLYETPEEQQFALKELFQSGAAVVPQMIEALKAGDAQKRLIILGALRRLGPEIVPPLMAALDSDDAVLKLDLIDLFLARGVRQVTPYLWFLAASNTQPAQVRAKARRALAYFRLRQEQISSDKLLLERAITLAAGKLPSAHVVLTRQAEMYYRHEVPFADPKAVTVWRWDGKTVVAGWPGAATVPASKAEEYYGVRFAGQALALDPIYRPAQDLMVSLLLEKTYEQGGLDRPLAKADPNVQAVVSSVNPDVVLSVLEKALDERKVSLILSATRTLGDLAEVRATRPTERAEPALTRALLFPDRRVQMAAAEALLRVPGDRSGLTAGRIVEVLRRALAADVAGAPKIVVGFVNDEFANKVVEAAKQAGFEPIAVKSGRDLLKRVLAASDIEAVVFDADLPDPGLASLLGQLHGDLYAACVPLFITPPHQLEDRLLAELRDLDDKLKTAGPGAKPALQLRRDTVDGQLQVQSLNSQAVLERYAKVYRHVVPLGTSSVINGKDLQTELEARLDVRVNPPLAASELTEYAEKAVRYLARAALGELPGLDVSVAADTIYGALRAKKLSPEGQIAAVAVAGRLPGRVAQEELLRVAVDADVKRPAAVRLAAALELMRHIQRNSPLLTDAEVQSLHDAYGKSNDAAYKVGVAQVFGALRPDARATGNILRGYQPRPPVVPAPK